LEILEGRGFCSLQKGRERGLQTKKTFHGRGRDIFWDKTIFTFFRRNQGILLKPGDSLKTQKLQQIKGNECLYQANLPWDSCNLSSGAQ